MNCGNETYLDTDHWIGWRSRGAGWRTAMALAMGMLAVGAVQGQPARLEVRMVPLITVVGAPGETNLIQCVDALGDTNAWITLTNVVLSDGPYEFYDRTLPPGTKRFYRALRLASEPRPAAPPGYVWLPPGVFTMGSPAAEQDRVGNEGPETVVTFTRGFFLCEHEVTQGEYVAAMGNNPAAFPGDPNRPVEQVSWSEATNYCGRLTGQERAAGRLTAGWAYRLPTEAEWEYAARAGTSTRFSFGDDPSYTELRNHAWYLGNSGSTTHPVATKLSNPWGLYDLHGNVSEWCLDWYAVSLPGGSAVDPAGPSSGSDRVIRGGAWVVIAGACRAAARSFELPGVRSNAIGFRPVLAAGQP